MLKTLIWCILWGGFVLFVVTWFCDWMDNRKENLREDHRKYKNREMSKWEATIYENWTAKGILGKLGTIIKIIITIVLLKEVIKMIIAGAFVGLGLVIAIVIACVIGGFPFLPL